MKTGSRRRLATPKPAARFAALLTSLLILTASAVPGALAADELNAASATVGITNTLNPKNLEVPPGTTVTWQNDDVDDHRMTSTSGPVPFRIDIDAGESGSFTFVSEGTYDYIDDRDDENSNYFGTIVVKAGADPGPGPTPPPPGGGGGSNIVEMRNRSFQPRSITVSVGESVTWDNRDDDDHNVIANDGSFQSPDFGPGGSWTSPAFQAAGTFNYFCSLHGGMTGSVVVTGAAGTPPPPDPTPPPAPTPPPPGDVTIIDNAFDPDTITISEGTTLTWSNAGALPHTVTRNGTFDSGFLSPGDTFVWSFEAAGTYNYLCTLHPGMTGSVLVTGTGGTPPPPDPTPPPPDPTPPPAAPPGDIRVIDNAFSPQTITIAEGTRLTWSNAGALPHTVTRNGTFDSGLLMPGDTYSRTFATAGTYNYLCTLHPGMTGTVFVTGAGGTPPPPDATPPDPGAPAPPPVAPPGDIRVVDNAFSPKTKTITAGTTLVWSNAGALPHTVTRSGAFDSGLLMPGDTYRRSFNTPGTYDYLCTLHPGMVGSVVVTGTATGEQDTESVQPGGGEAGAPPTAPGNTGSETGGSDTGSSTTSTGATADVDVIDLDYDPRTLNVVQGTTVVWTNVGELPHTVTANDGSYDSGIMAAGSTFQWTFATAGTYDYLCTLHPGMIGTVIVNAAPAEEVATAGVAAGGNGGGAAGGATAPSLAVSVILALGLLAAGVALAVGMAAFGRFAATEEH